MFLIFIINLILGHLLSLGMTEPQPHLHKESWRFGANTQIPSPLPPILATQVKWNGTGGGVTEE